MGKRRKSKKVKIWNPQNLLRTLKAMVVSIIVGVPTVLFQVIAMKWIWVGAILTALYIIPSLFLWGWLVKKWWGWN